jgi:hypothetical protein
MEQTGGTGGSSKQTQGREALSVKPPATGRIYCHQAQELLEALTEAIHQLVMLHEEQFQSLIAGDLDSTRFDSLIHMANERKHAAKYAYLDHLEHHACSVIATRI